MTGRKLQVMIEGKLTEEDVYIGRSYMDAPDVDGYVFLKNNGREYMSGDIVSAIINDTEGYDLLGEIWK